MKEELCGKVALYRVEFLLGAKMCLCTRHFSKPDIQYLLTIKRAVFEFLENGEEKCEAKVERRDGPGKLLRAEKRILFR
ncbi:hypothetical protein ES705_42872 [subsurface metagenome]